jgi:hypoxanthine phosphoribosyltransferase
MKSLHPGHELNLLVSGEDIRRKTAEMAKELSDLYAGEEVVCICVLKGAFLFFADLVRRMDPPVTVDFVRLASYGDRTSPGEELVFSKDMEESIRGRHALIVEDIVDTGRSMAYLKNVFHGRGPKSLKICALVDKQERRQVDLAVDYYGFNLTGEGFLVGYGMDCGERYRELDGIYELIRSTKTS